MSAFQLPPGPSDWTPTDASPFLSRPMGPPRRSAMDALQEHIAILRLRLQDAEQDVDKCEPEEYEDLKKALLLVSCMISQIEHTAHLLTEKQRNMKNELRTLQDENLCLKKALFRVRAKRRDRIDQSPSSMVSAGFGMQSPTPAARHVCGVIDNQLDKFRLAQSIIPVHALADEDNSFMDLDTSDNAASNAASMFNYSIAATHGPSGGVKRGLQVSPVGHNTDVLRSELRTGSAKRASI